MPDFMDIDWYQHETGKTAVYPHHTELSLGIIYCALKLAGEAGEYSEKIGKIIRDDDGVITPETKKLLALELGDILWYVSQSARELGYALSEIADANLEKLESRLVRNKLHGSGDNR